ncbi:hypothetical protein [Sinirhodobacter huangdaonensis]|uniref:Uncharacterized protein n=1 Tax=Paenirhodobacter huangdaonensis TaxID=2501515 RepID=A0A3S4MFE3_9RHOB|nr:hypothetical protein [Sinirhodobacter huangdaonensis]RWR50341.1 hypothetical protein EOW66_15165 [Sinirhodobacter huangdaonensis]
MPCIVSGPVRAINGAILPGTTVVVERRGVYGQDGAMVLPARQGAIVGADGTLSVELYPGPYIGLVRLGRELWEFRLSVPEAARAALADCLDQMPVLTPLLVVQTREAAAAATGAAQMAKADAVATAQDREAVNATAARVATDTASAAASAAAADASARAAETAAGVAAAKAVAAAADALAAAQDREAVDAAAARVATDTASAAASASAADASAQSAETAAGIARSPAASLYGACGGSANAITVTTGLSGIAIGTEIRFRAIAANTGPATLTVDGTGAIPCRTITGAVLPAGYIRTTVDTVARYDGTYWVLGREIERGSNGAGEYERRADGAQICTYSAVGAAGPIMTAEGAIWRSTEYSWTFPASFTATGNLAVNGSLRTGAAAWNKVRVTGISSASVMLFAANSNVNNFTVDFNAIGRWY